MVVALVRLMNHTYHSHSLLAWSGEIGSPPCLDDNPQLPVVRPSKHAEGSYLKHINHLQGWSVNIAKKPSLETNHLPELPQRHSNFLVSALLWLYHYSLRSRTDILHWLSHLLNWSVKCGWIAAVQRRMICRLVRLHLIADTSHQLCFPRRVDPTFPRVLFL
jgi:hypothetical protein